MTYELRLDLAALASDYERGACTPVDVIEALYARLEKTPHAGVFIYELPLTAARDAARAVMERKAKGEKLPLYGVPFAVKDNIDVAGMPTTAACPAFSYEAKEHATVVAKLVDAGALVIGKTNLDQFATGLVGVRSPYGVPENPFDKTRVPGGSSSGSAVAVARGFCSFALGTDTAGSGRVPAAFNNVVGLKPTRGMLSASGVVPACRSLDCVSVFAQSVSDAADVAEVAAGFDARDPYSRATPSWDPRPARPPVAFRFASPRADQLLLRSERDRALYTAALQAAAAQGGQASELDFAPFASVAALLYQGAFVAERLEAAGELLAELPDEIHPVVREILVSAKKLSALDLAKSYAKLETLRRACQAQLVAVDCMIVPSAPQHPRVAEVQAEPLRINTELGTYTNFVNLLDLCALAIPAGFHKDGVPFGVTLIGKRGHDALLASIGERLHASLAKTVGALGTPLPAARVHAPAPSEHALLAVVGAHLSGEALHHQLVDLNARLVSATRTAPKYRFYALPTTPPKPGLVRVPDGEKGHAIEVEVYALTHAALGAFMKNVASPLCIGTLELESGQNVQGFLCEHAATLGRPDISHHGGFRAYRRALSATGPSVSKPR